MIKEFSPDRQASNYLSFIVGKDVLYDPDTDELREDNNEMFEQIKNTTTHDWNPKAQYNDPLEMETSENMIEFLRSLDKILKEMDGYEVPGIKKIFFNGNHTTILWSDNTRTTVGCMEGEKFDEYAGFAAAILKKMFGSSITAKKFLDSHKAVQTPTAKKEKKDA